MKQLFCALCAASAVALATPAAAQMTTAGTGTGTTATINTSGTGGSTTLNFDGNVGGTTVTGLTSSLLLNYLGATSNGTTSTLNFSYSLTDTGSVGSRVSGFGFNTNPLALSGTTSGLFDTVLVGGNFPNGIGNISVCMLSNPGNGNGAGCGGGSNGGAANGAGAQNGTFSLVFNDTPATVTLSGFAVRYQSIVGVTAGTSGTGTPVGGVPEPATWAMMMVGFGAIGWTIRRRRKVSSIPQLA